MTRLHRFFIRITYIFLSLMILSNLSDFSLKGGAGLFGSSDLTFFQFGFMDSRKNIFGFSDSNFRRGSGFLLIYYRIYGSVLESLRIFGFTISPLIHFLFLDDFLWITRRNFRQMYISRFLMVKAKPWTPEIRVKRQNGNIKEIHVSDPDLEKNMFGFSDFCKYLVGFSDPAHPLPPHPP